MKVSTPTLLLCATPLMLLPILSRSSSSEVIPCPDVRLLGELPTPHLDILPGNCPNNFRLDEDGGEPDGDESSATAAAVRASVLGNKFSVAQVNISTLFITRAGSDTPYGVRPFDYSFRDQGRPFEGPPCGCHTLGGDEQVDLNLKFYKQELIDVLELGNLPHGTDLGLEVRGELNNGQPFAAVDCIKIINP